MNSDLIELLQLLNETGVKYLIIGGQAVIVYSEPRYTKDLDIWVEASKQNATKLVKALAKFGAPRDAISVEDFVKPGTMFIFGLEPNRVDILTSVKGRSFKVAYKDKTLITIGKLKVPLVSLRDLIKIKRSTARPQDLLDLEKLLRAQRVEKKRLAKGD